MADGSLSAAPAIRLGRNDLNTNRKDNFDFLVLFFDGGVKLSDLSTTVSIIIQSFYSLSNWRILYLLYSFLLFFKTATLFLSFTTPYFIIHRWMYNEIGELLQTTTIKNEWLIKLIFFYILKYIIIFFLITLH